MFNHRRSRGLFIPLLATAALGTGLASCGSADGSASVPVQPTTASVPAPELEWTDCGDGLQCASAEVPLDYDDVFGAQLTLQLIKRPATDTDHRVGSLFVNDGGPGNSPVEFVRGDAVDVLPEDVQARFDVIGFDPRGVGSSAPIRCFADAETQAEVLGSHTGFPLGADEEAAFAAGSAAIAAACAEQNGSIIEHVSTANAARDLDVLRRAVDDDHLNFAGYSYGALLGLTYAQLFPETIRTLLLDGITDPVAWSTSDAAATAIPVSARLGSERATLSALRSFIDFCQASDGCSFGGDDVAAKFDDLMSALSEEPIMLDTPDGSFPVTYSFVVDSMRGGLQFPPAWPFVADQLQALYETAFPSDSASDGAAPDDEGQGSDEASEPDTSDGDAAAEGEGEGEATEPEAPVYDNSTEALLAVLCSETSGPTDPTAWSADASGETQAALFAGAWAFISQPCATWTARDADAYHGTFTAATSAPVLFVNSRFDAASDYDTAVRVAADVPGSTLLTLDGPGHPASFVGNSCVDAAVSAYLLDGVVPATGAVCDNELVPFG